MALSHKRGIYVNILTIHIACLTYLLVRLCIGTGRLPLSSRSESDSDVIDWSSASCTTLESGRDVRLGLSGKIYAAAEAGLRLRFEKEEDLEPFYLKSAEIFSEMDSLANFLTPLSGMFSAHDKICIILT